ncbi:lipopolysaccharide biosynthesis protein [Candidatus Nitrospira bockiana]
MIHPLSLQRNFSWTMAGNVVYSACQWGILLILVRLGSPAEVGQFALGLAVTAPVMIFANLGLRQIQATDAQREYDFSDYWGLRLVTTALALLFICGIALLTGHGSHTALVIIAVGFAKAMESLSDVAHGLLQQYRRMDFIAKSQMARGVLAVGTVWSAMQAAGGLVWGLLLMGGAWMGVLLAYDVPNARSCLTGATARSDDGPGLQSPVRRLTWDWIRPTLDRQTLCRLGLMACPLGFVAMLNSLSTNVPRYFIAANLGERELGIFAALAYFSTSGHLIGSALQQSASPVAGRYWADADTRGLGRLLRRLIGVCVAIGGIGVLAVMIAGEQFLDWVYGPDYAEASDVLLLLMTAAAFVYLNWPLDTGLIAVRRFSLHLGVNVVNMALVVALCAVLTPAYGLHGAALAILCACAIAAGLKLWALRSILTTGGRTSGRAVDTPVLAAQE